MVTGRISLRAPEYSPISSSTPPEDEIGEYSAARKEIRPVTIATYQVLTTRRKGVYTHLELFDAPDWGLEIYDEVHLLRAPVFRMTADLQARRRLGLTATLVREDGREDDVLTLIGPKRFDALGRGDPPLGLDVLPWRVEPLGPDQGEHVVLAPVLEHQGRGPAQPPAGL